jgi:hypothetical protein
VVKDPAPALTLQAVVRAAAPRMEVLVLKVSHRTRLNV